MNECSRGEEKPCRGFFVRCAIVRLSLNSPAAFELCQAEIWRLAPISGHLGNFVGGLFCVNTANLQQIGVQQ